MNLLDLAVKVGLKDEVSTKLDSISGKAKNSLGDVGSMATAFGNVLASAFMSMTNAIGSAVDGAVSRVDTLNQYPKVLQQMGYTGEQAEASIQKLSDGIQGLPTTLDAIADNAKSLALSSGDLDSATDAAIALNDAFLASGSSGEQAEAGMRQYTQMLSKGAVDMESWRALQENMKYALQETAEAMGYTGSSATNDLYEALKNGDVTFDEFQQKLIECDQAAGGFAETAGAASAGIETSMTNVESAITRNLANIIEAFNSTGLITDTLSGVKEGINGIGESLDPIAEELAGRLQGISEAVSEAMSEGGLGAASEVASRKILELVSSMAGSLIEQVPTLLDSFYQMLYGAAQGIVNALPDILQNLTDLINQMAAWITESGPGFQDQFLNIMVSLADAIGQALPSIIAALLNLGSAMFQSLITFIPKLGTAGVKIIGGLLKGVVGSIPSVLSFIASIPSKIVAALGSVGNLLLNAGKSIIDGLLNGIKGAIDGVYSFVSGIAGTIASLKGPIEYDRKLLIPHGKAIMAGLSEGLETGFGGVTSLVGGMAGRMADAFGSPQLAFGTAGYGGYTMRSVGGVNVFLEYHAGEDANQLALDFASAISRQNLLGGSYNG